MIELLAGHGEAQTSPGVGAKRSTRFTRIELLVVVAIVATLASMLLPALQQVWEQARLTACIGNLRQVSLAVESLTCNDALNDAQCMLYGR